MTQHNTSYPEVGALRECLVCARSKPWGIFHEPTGVTVCVECRDLARTGKARGDVLALKLERFLDSVVGEVNDFTYMRMILKEFHRGD